MLDVSLVIIKWTLVAPGLEHMGIFNHLLVKKIDVLMRDNILDND